MSICIASIVPFTSSPLPYTCHTALSMVPNLPCHSMIECISFLLFIVSPLLLFSLSPSFFRVGSKYTPTITRTRDAGNFCRDQFTLLLLCLSRCRYRYILKRLSVCAGVFCSLPSCAIGRRFQTETRETNVSQYYFCIDCITFLQNLCTLRLVSFFYVS